MTNHGGQKMLVTITWEYEAHEGNYDGATDPKVWAQMDADNMQKDPGLIGVIVRYVDYRVKVVPR